MNTIRSASWWLAVLGLGMVWLGASGCATSAVWRPTAFGPTSRPDLVVLREGSDDSLLVVYTERIAGGEEVGRRVYRLNESETGSALTEPNFLSLTCTNGLIAVPLLRFGDDPKSGVKPLPLAILWEPSDTSFRVSRNGNAGPEHRLPFYQKQTRPVERALAMPVAVGLDAAAVGAVTGGFMLGALGGTQDWDPCISACEALANGSSLLPWADMFARLWRR